MLNPTEQARLAQLEAIPVAQRTPAQVKEISDLETKQKGFTYLTPVSLIPYHLASLWKSSVS